MKPPVPSPDGPNGLPDAQVSADFLLPLVILRKRADFLALRNTGHSAKPGLILQARERALDEFDDRQIRVGFTCTKKLGNAVRRNRAKRRLREIARLALPRLGRAGWDYVLIGRHRATETLDFEALQADLETALAKVHRSRGS